MFFLILLGIAIFGGIVYLAITPKSSFITRIVAIGALALMVLAVIVCLLFIFGVVGSGAQTVQMLPDAVLSNEPVVQQESNYIGMILFIFFLLALMLLIVLLSMREQKRSMADKKAKSEKNEKNETDHFLLDL